MTRPQSTSVIRCRWPASRSRTLPLPFLRPLLQQVFGLFEFVLPLRRQAFAGAVDEVLDHANPRTDALRAHLFASHRPSDGLSVFREQARGRKGRICLHLVAPAFFSQTWPSPRNRADEIEIRQILPMQLRCQTRRDP